MNEGSGCESPGFKKTKNDSTDSLAGSCSVIVLEYQTTCHGIHLVPTVTPARVQFDDGGESDNTIKCAKTASERIVDDPSPNDGELIPTDSEWPLVNSSPDDENLTYRDEWIESCLREDRGVADAATLT